ncbi:hypothetical protein LPB138_01090 [Urechidicola croceus]|uniref:Uncharacterized protein n=1 Tax=Urechidicola croceus TaxID=1850246 RepID=A0A1D8P451_9FLAO|nr:hypothetical protein LPB138_01090 [Urechidicola croceus]
MKVVTEKIKTTEKNNGGDFANLYGIKSCCGKLNFAELNVGTENFNGIKLTHGGILLRIEKLQ